MRPCKMLPANLLTNRPNREILLQPKSEAEMGMAENEEGRNNKKHKKHRRADLMCLLRFLWFLPLLS